MKQYRIGSKSIRTKQSRPCFYIFLMNGCYPLWEADIGKLRHIRVEADISNVGEYDSAQTLQVYVSTGLKDAPKVQLKGLKKVAVKKNETKHVEITLTDKAFALYNEDGEMVLTKGSCKVYVGSSQPDARSRKLTGNNPVEFEVKIPENRIITE